MIKKDLIVAIVLTFCLTVSLSMIVKTTASPFIYDPWADINDDGKIDIKDIAYSAKLFGTVGDPAKNVTITGHANKLALAISTGLDPDSSYDTGWISIDGYSKVTVCVGSDATQYSLRIMTKSYSAGLGYTVYYYENSTGTSYCDLVKTFDVPNEQIRIGFYNIHPTSRDLWIDVYLIP